MKTQPKMPPTTQTKHTPDLMFAHMVLQDKAASYWLKETIKRGLERDIVDVQNEIEILNNIFIGKDA